MGESNRLGSASAIGVEFEKVASWIATISSKTREGAETIGNSLKGIMARFQQIRESGFNEEDSVGINDVSKALAQAGIQAIDAQGQFRNFGTIMDELGGKWKNLDSKTKAYIATTLAGTNQQSRFLNLLNNYGESVDLYEQSLESAGTTTQKYNLYLQGTEAKLSQLKATGEGVWLKIFNSSDMQTAVGSLASLVDGIGWLVDKLGSLPAVAGTASLALGLFTKKYTLLGATTKDAIKVTDEGNMVIGKQFQFYGRLSGAVNKLIKEQVALHNQQQIANVGKKDAILLTMRELTAKQQLGYAIEGLKTKLVTLNGGMILAKLGALGLSAGVAILQGVLSMGLSMAVTAVIGAIDKLIVTSKEAQEQINELNSSYQQSIDTNNGNIRTLSSMKDEFESLANNTNKTADEQARFNELCNEIARISPNVAEAYDTQGNAIIRNKNAVDELIKSYQEANEYQNNKLLSEFNETYNNGMKSVDKNMNKYNNLKSEVEQLEKVNEQRRESLKHLKESKVSVEEIAIAEKDIEDRQEVINKKAKEMQGVYADASTALKANFSNSFKAMLQDNERFGDAFKNNANAMKVAMDMLQDVSFMQDKTALSDWENKVIPELEKLANSDIWTKLEKKVEDLNKTFRDNQDLDAYQKNLKEFTDTMAKGLNVSGGSDITERVSQWLQNLHKTPDAINNVTNAMENHERRLKELQEAYVVSIDKIEDYNKLLHELNSKDGQAKSNTMKNLIKNHAELAPYLDNEKLLIDKITEALKNEKNVANDTYKQMMLYSEEYYNLNIRGTDIIKNALGSYYNQLSDGQKQDLANAKTLAGAKLAVEGELINRLSRLWDSYNRAVSNVINKHADIARKAAEGGDEALVRISKIFNYSASASGLRGTLSEIRSVQAEIGRINTSFNSITANIKPPSQYGNNYGSGSKKKDKKNETTYTSELNNADKYMTYLNEINKALDKQDDLMSSISEKSKMYKQIGDRASLLKALEEENKLYAEQSTMLNMLKNDEKLLKDKKVAISQDFKNKFSGMKNKNITNWTEADFEKQFESMFPTKTFKKKADQEAYEKQKKLFLQLQEDWFKYADAIDNISDRIETTQSDMIDTLQERYSVYFSVLQKDFDSTREKIDTVKYNMNMLDDGEDYDKREKYAQQLVANVTTYRDTIQNAINTLTDKQKTLKKNSTEWIIINDQLKEYQGNLRDANLELRDANELVAQIKQEEMNMALGLQEKIVSALREKHNKARQEELDVIIENREKEKERLNGELDDLRKELEELQDNTKEKQDDLDAKKAKLELWKKDNSAYKQGKVKELEKEIAQLEKELAIKAKEDEIKEKEEEIKAVEDSANAEIKVVEDKYKDLLDEQNLYSEATTIMAGKTQDEILELLLSYDEKYKGMGTKLGEAYREAMLAEIEKAKDALKELEDGMPATPTPSTPPATPATPATPTTTTTPNTSTTTPKPSTGNSGSSGNNSGSGSSGTPWNGTVYKQGMKGDIVKKIQAKVGAKADGVWGSETTAKVKAWQKAHGLKADGIVGKDTWNAMFGSSNSSGGSSSGSAKTTSIAWDGKVYNVGDKGETVKRIQKNLNTHGYKLKEDGMFGQGTYNAVISFQKKNGLKPDGVIGKGTWEKLIKFDTGGYTGDFGTSGKLAVLHQKERVLNPIQTKAFEHLIYSILPKFYNNAVMDKINSTFSRIVFNEPIIRNDINITNNTPFDVTDNMDNLNRAFKQELRQAGFRLNLIR